MSVTRQYFGTDGIRAVANRHPMTPEFVLRLGQAAAAVLAPPSDRRRSCVMGRDTRASGEMLAAALSAGLNSVGVDVLDVGILPTPAVAFLTTDLQADFGVIVSASHNPFEDNGIKFVHGNGSKLSDETEGFIESQFTENETTRCEGLALGRITTVHDGMERYVAHAIRCMEGTRLDGMRIALDNANGAASQTSPLALQKLGAEVQSFFSEPDGYNINGNCGCTHPREIERLVKETGAHVGMAHDGDADRIVLCDETGSALGGDELLAVATQWMLRNRRLKNQTVAVTVMSNLGLDDLIREEGGKVVRTGVGDRQVLAAMRQHDLNFGGEQSGHVIFSDWIGTGDGLIAGLHLLRVMKETGQPLSELRRCLKTFPQSIRNLRVSRKPPISELTEAQMLIAETEQALGGRGRILLRYSGTESLIRLLLEGPEADYLENRADRIAAAILAQIG